MTHVTCVMEVSWNWGLAGKGGGGGCSVQGETKFAV